jgi:D-beta-D-heptose 7-phosphate kinase/D-beta-D-heptose 1-phosphate adenosyltransferase
MSENLKDILSRKKPLKILVAGDLVLDEYLWGTVSRISPEAPIQVLESASENQVPGGAANVANNLQALRCEVYLSGMIGGDEKGQQLVHLLKRKGIRVDGVVVDPFRPTTRKVRAIAHSQQILRIDREVRRPMSGGVQKKALDYLADTIPEVDGIICSDYQKGFLTEALLRSAVRRARSGKIPVVVDSKGSDYSRYRGVAAITPNIHEVEIASRIAIGKPADLDRAVERVFAVTRAKIVLVTRGGDGVSLYVRGKPRIDVPAEAREIYDVTGAGDTVTAVFGRGLFGGADPADAARLANMAGGIVVGKVGTATVGYEELSYYLEGGHPFQGRKTVDLDECKLALSRARNQGRRVVFTNGCFDLLHVGHLQFLQAARSKGDLLVVGLNDDRSVARLKGRGRPIIGESERARILSALDCVDYVILFSEPTPERLLTELRPDVLVKGADYRLDQVVGRKLVEGYGGRVELIPLVPGQSTSRIVQSIIKRYRGKTRKKSGS